MSNAYVSRGFMSQDSGSAMNGLASGLNAGGRGPCACGCGKSVTPTDRQLNINGDKWLANCFRCGSCDLPIDVKQDGGYVVKKGQNWCQKCDKYDARLNNDHSGQQVKVNMQNQGPSIDEAWGVTSKHVPDAPPSNNYRGGYSGGGASSSSSAGGPPPVPRDAMPTMPTSEGGYSGASSPSSAGGPPPVPRDAMPTMPTSEGKEFCAVCNRVIQGTGYGAKGRWYHPECFKCGKCGQLITDQRFVADGGEVFHPKCAPPRGPPCTACGEPLVGTYRIFQDKKYHAKCLVCAGCRGPLDGGYILKGNDPYCRECVMNPGSRPAGGAAAAARTGGTTSGIRFNHQSQKASSTSGGPPPASAAGGPPPPPAGATGGMEIPKFCGSCGAKTNPGGKFCGECGQSFF